MTEDMIDVECLLEHETPKAYLVDVEVIGGLGFSSSERDQVWLPKSQVSLQGPDTEGSEQHTISAPEWLWVEKCRSHNISISGYLEGDPVIIDSSGID